VICVLRTFFEKANITILRYYSLKMYSSNLKKEDEKTFFFHSRGEGLKTVRALRIAHIGDCEMDMRWFLN